MGDKCWLQVELLILHLDFTRCLLFKSNAHVVFQACGVSMFNKPPVIYLFSVFHCPGIKIPQEMGLKERHI